MRDLKMQRHGPGTRAPRGLAEAASTVARRVVWFHSTGSEVSPKAS